MLPLGVARATVTQPDGTVMPQPANPSEVTEMMQRGFPADSVTLPGLFMYNEINGGDPGLDWRNDAHTTPGTFSPQCGLSGTIVCTAASCQNALGWYNATDPATKPTNIYPIVPANLQHGAAERHLVQGERLLSAGDPHEHAGGPAHLGRPRCLILRPTSGMTRTGPVAR